MGVLDGLQEGILTTPGQFVFDRFGDEAASVPFNLIDSGYEIGRQRDGDTLHRRHA